jgi:hypothetical protein
MGFIFLRPYLSLPKRGVEGTVLSIQEAAALARRWEEVLVELHAMQATLDRLEKQEKE